MWVGTDAAPRYAALGFADAAAGGQAHELWHTMSTAWADNGYHAPTGNDLMNGGWPSVPLSSQDLNAALNCTCNTVVRH